MHGIWQRASFPGLGSPGFPIFSFLGLLSAADMELLGLVSELGSSQSQSLGVTLPLSVGGTPASLGHRYISPFSSHPIWAKVPDLQGLLSLMQSP